MVERSLSLLKGPRRLRVRYERCGQIVSAWATLAMSVITFRLWNELPQEG